MNIRTKLTVTFFSIVIVVLTVICVSIYFFSANYRQVDFYRRLKNRAINTAKVLMEVEEVNADLLRRMERNNPASLPNQYIVMYDYRNQELYSSEGTSALPIDTSLLNRIRKQNEVRFEYSNYEVLGFVFRDDTETFTIVAAASDVYGLDALDNLAKVLVITFSVSVVLVSIIGWVYAGRVLSPISRIVREVGTITEASLSQRLDEGNKRDELGQLARTFNMMLERLENAFAAQKNFIANASHEIKTPITVMSGEIDVTLLQERENSYYVKTLQSVLTGLKGLDQLSTQLLLLAQTSADQPNRSFTLIRIDDILWEVQDELTKAHSDYTVDILFDMNLNHESLLVNGDEQLMKVAIFNLMENGCKYSVDNHVAVNLKSSSNSITLEFVNKGENIPLEVRERIFEPFFRGNNSRKVKGFGIGLSLVKRIITLHKGEVSLNSSVDQETNFTVVLPVGGNGERLILI